MNWHLLTNCVFGLLHLFKNDQPKIGSAPRLIPRKVMFAPADYSDVSLSPDGKWLSWIAPIGTVPNVWVKEMPDGTARNLTHETGRGIPGVSWLYDNKTLIYSQDGDGDENWRLYTLDVKTGNVRVITDSKGVRASILASSEHYPDRLIIGLNDRDPRYHDAYDLNVTTGNKTLIFENNFYAGYVFDDAMQIRMLSNETDEAGVNYYKYENRTVILYRTVDFEDSDMVFPMGFDKTGQVVYWADNNGKDLPSYYEVDWTTDEKRLIYQPKRAAVTGMTFHPVTRKPISVVEDYAKPERILLDKTYEKDFKLLQQLLPGNAKAWINDYSLDFDTWIVSPHSDTESTAYFYYHRNNPYKNITFMFYAKKSLRKYTYTPMRAVEIPIADNLTQLCYLSLPLESDPLDIGVPVQPVPMILNVHGGPWSRDGWGFDVEVQFFANRGYAVLQCNYRASTGFGKKFVNAGNGQWGKKMQQDLTDAVQWAVRRKIADPKKVAIYGGSYGGYAALAGLTFTPDLYACGVDIVGPSNLVTLMRSIPPYWKPAYHQMTKRIGAGPETPEGRKFLESVSPLFFVDKIKRPLLIGQGANDPRVKQNESDQIVNALHKSNIPVTYVVFPNEGHGFARPENSLAFYTLTEQFLKSCLGGRAEPIEDEIAKSSALIKSVS